MDAGFSTHAARWSRQPASGLWHMFVMVPFVEVNFFIALLKPLLTQP